MSARLARTAEAWWVVTPAGLVRLGLPATTTAALLADRAALAAAIEAAQTAAAAAPREAVPTDSLGLLSPVTAPARVVAQAVNTGSSWCGSVAHPGPAPPQDRAPGRTPTGSTSVSPASGPPACGPWRSWGPTRR